MEGKRPLRRCIATLAEVQGNQAPRVRLQPNVKKIVEAISFVIGEGEKRGYVLTQYDILKTLFLADKAHLNTFGRPITFDNYHAMRNGPVPSLAYDVLKQAPSALAAASREGFRTLPWTRTAQPEPGSGRYYYSNGKSAADEDVLSESDVRALADALTTVKSLRFRELRKMLHSDEAYLEAWDGDSRAKSFLMSYGMLFETPNFELAERVQFLSKTI